VHGGLGLPDDRDGGGAARRPGAGDRRPAAGHAEDRYRANGHNHQRPGLTIYLPGNGGLLSAAATMAGGWDGAPAGHAPGFPADGSWTVRWEGLQPMP
jgi:hypothetical protein